MWRRRRTDEGQDDCDQGFKTGSTGVQVRPENAVMAGFLLLEGQFGIIDDRSFGHGPSRRCRVSIWEYDPYGPQVAPFK